MKRIRIFWALATTVLISAISCQQDDTLQYNNITMGNVTAGRFVSDQGNIFNVVEQNCTGQIDTMKRALVVCDILHKTEGKENEYDVRLNMVNHVLTKAPLTLSEITDEDANVTDPIQIKEMWYSGGYLNMFIMIPVERGSTGRHLVNLVIDDKTSTGDSYTLELRHNGFGEVWSQEDQEYVLAGAYVSFRLGDLFTGNSAKVTLLWKWHKAVGNGWSLEIVDNKLEFEWTRGSFEQAPLSLASKAADIM